MEEVEVGKGRKKGKHGGKMRRLCMEGYGKTYLKNKWGRRREKNEREI